MKKSNWKFILILGVVVVLLLAGANWYAITFNDWRLVAPMDFETYEFLPGDLPMWVAILLVNLYVIYLMVLLIRTVIANKRRLAKTKTTRKLDPRLGLLGFAGFFGCLGFWTYSAFHQVYPFIFFSFFGFFGFFYEGKMSDTLMDERFEENRVRADAAAHRVTQIMVFLTLLLVSRGALLGNLEYTLIAVLIV
ncbi:MAG: DUF3796 domain-containing protein, partial [Oscillospiraceae bacterium]|nr:DUF3796 domain-containing protein [Oscillospiraceae bacterium]